MRAWVIGLVVLIVALSSVAMAEPSPQAGLSEGFTHPPIRSQIWRS